MRQIAEATRGGALTATQVVSAFSEQVQRREPDIEAWAFFDEDLCLSAARELDAADDKGPLCGVPVAIKDVFDTCDMPTEMGSPIDTVGLLGRTIDDVELVYRVLTNQPTDPVLEARCAVTLVMLP